MAEESPSPTPTPEPATPARKSGWMNLTVDYGPILVFFLVYRYFAPKGAEAALSEVTAVIAGTLAFMVAAVAALGFSLWRFRKVSPMLWLSTLLIVVFGGMTVLLR